MLSSPSETGVTQKLIMPDCDGIVSDFPKVKNMWCRYYCKQHYRINSQGGESSHRNSMYVGNIKYSIYSSNTRGLHSGAFNICLFTTGLLCSSMATVSLWRCQETKRTASSGYQACSKSKSSVGWRAMITFNSVFPRTLPAYKWSYFDFQNAKWVEQSTTDRYFASWPSKIKETIPGWFSSIYLDVTLYVDLWCELDSSIGMHFQRNYDLLLHSMSSKDHKIRCELIWTPFSSFDSCVTRLSIFCFFFFLSICSTLLLS